MMVGDFKTPLSPMNMSSRQQINKEMLDITDIISQMHLTYFQNILANHKQKYTFSTLYGTFFENDHMLRHKVSLNRYK